MTADPIGGVWQYALELCQALEPYGAEILLATLGAPLTDQQRRHVHAQRHVELAESRFLLEWMESPWESLEEASTWLLRLERTFSPHVIHLNHLMHADLPWEAPVLTVGHSCVLSWWAAVRGDGPVGWARYQREVARSLRAARCVCAPTQAMMRALRRHYGPLKHCQVIPNGRNAEQYTARPKLPYIFAAGRIWDAAKNIAALDAIAPALPWPVFVAGATTNPNREQQRRHAASGADADAVNGTDGAQFGTPWHASFAEPPVGAHGKQQAMQRECLLNAAAAGRIEPSAATGAQDANHAAPRLTGLHALGPLSADALADWYSTASIYALPARYEPFGLTVLEAALSGCALVLGDIESLREVWGNAARYVPPHDTEALRNALTELITDAGQRTQLAALAQKRAQRYTMQRCAERYWQTYQSLLPLQELQPCVSSFSTIH